MMKDNKHYKAEKRNGFWDFVERDQSDQPRHALKGGHNTGERWMGCNLCREELGMEIIR